MAELPARIGPYEVSARLGVGGMAETYVGVRRGPGGFEQRVCLKVVRRDHVDDPDRVRQFLAEAALVARLRHAAITQVLDFGRAGDGYYLALELVDGLDLSQLLRAGALPPELVLYVAVELATALDFAHRAGGDASLGPIVHRDVSPSNALISVEGEVKLSDFGIARPLEGPQHTATGIVKGKVPYLAPEYARSGRFDARCDLFSLGALLYECASGVAPHDGATDIETIERAARGERVPLADSVPDLPPALAEIIERLLEADPELRLQSAGEVLEALATLQVSARAARELGRRVVEARGPQRLAMARATPVEQLGSAPTELRPSSAPRSAEHGVAQGGQTLPLPPRLDLVESEALARSPLGRGPKLALAAAALAVIVVTAVAVTKKSPSTRATPLPSPATARASSPSPAPRAAPSPSPSPSPSTDLGANRGAAAATPSSEAVPTGAAPSVLRPTSTTSAKTKPTAGPKAARTATLEVIAVPYGEISIDGVHAGKSPLTRRISPGDHVITSRNGDGTLERHIKLAPGERKQLVLR